jgi:oligoribonuclease (3'-5' exoribonuclease)
MTTTDQPPLLLWCDFETDGLDIATLEILEACFVVTDINLVELGRYSTLVRTRRPLYRVAADMPTIVRDMHEASGLTDALAKANAVGHDWVTIDRAQFKALGMFRDSGQPVALAGAGVAGFDRHVIRTWMPELDKRLTYWCVDTSAVDRFGHLFAGIPRQSGEAAHRAEADVDHAIGVARVWRERMGHLADTTKDRGDFYAGDDAERHARHQEFETDRHFAGLTSVRVAVDPLDHVLLEEPRNDGEGRVYSFYKCSCGNEYGQGTTRAMVHHGAHVAQIRQAQS